MHARGVLGAAAAGAACRAQVHAGDALPPRFVAESARGNETRAARPPTSHAQRSRSFTLCYVLWAVTAGLTITSHVRVLRAARRAASREELGAIVKSYGGVKCLLLVVFVICTVGHFAGPPSPMSGVMAIPCLALGVVLPLAFCAKTDKYLAARGRELGAPGRPPAPEAAVHPGTRCASLGCRFTGHSDAQRWNGGGAYCCQACMDGGTQRHGGRCQRREAARCPAPELPAGPGSRLGGAQRTGDSRACAYEAATRRAASQARSASVPLIQPALPPLPAFATLEPSAPPLETPPQAGDGCCVVCMERAKVVVVWPCKHLCLCQACAYGGHSWKECPVCRACVSSMDTLFV